MKKKILALCLLTALCIPVFCVERFRDGDADVSIEYVKAKKNDFPNWVQASNEALRRTFAIFSLSSSPLNKLSDTDTRRINKALQKFKLVEDEIYYVQINTSTSAKNFYVLITRVQGGQYWWNWVG